MITGRVHDWLQNICCAPLVEGNGSSSRKFDVWEQTFVAAFMRTLKPALTQSLAEANSLMETHHVQMARREVVS